MSTKRKSSGKDKSLQFHTDLKFLPVESISKNTWNPNEVSDDMMHAIKDNIQKHGFIGAIIVQKRNKGNGKNNVIINGEHRYDALVELGYKTVPCHILDVDDKLARLLTLRLNREHGVLVPDKIKTLLSDLQPDLDLDSLAQMTAMTTQELELITALDISGMLEHDSGIPADSLPLQNQQIENVFSEESKGVESITLGWANIEALVKKLAVEIKKQGKTYGVILAVSKGGLIPGRLMQRELGIPEIRLLPIDKKKFVITDDASIKEGREGGQSSRRFLVVDDIYDTGKTTRNIKDFLDDSSLSDLEYDFAVLLAKEPVPDHVSYGYKIAKSNPNYSKWIVFPWEKGIEA